MNPSFYFSQLQQFLKTFFRPLQGGALIHQSGACLWLNYQNLVDIGSLPTAATTAHNYLKIKDGEIIISNDPYSGGSLLSSFTLTLGLTTQATRKTKEHYAADLLLSYRISMKPHLTQAQKVDEEGLRIPPSPLYTPHNDDMNTDLIKAIESHPLAPIHFQQHILNAIHFLKQKHHAFKDLTLNLGLDWSKTLIKKYLSLTQKLLTKRLSLMAPLETHTEYTLEDGKKIRLHIHMTEKKVTFDFTGTESSSLLHMTDTATYGACAGALLSFLEEDLPINQGFYNTVEVIAPSGTIVNAVYPQPVTYGLIDGTALIAFLALQALGETQTHKQLATTNPSHCAFELEFKNKKKFYETLKPGLPATSNRPGEDGAPLWQKTELNPRIELIEKLYPLQVQSYSFRQNSAGKGRFQGGRGEMKAFQLKEDATLRWAFLLNKHGVAGKKGGRSAREAEAQILSATGEKKQLPSRGEISLKAGDTFVICSAGGGGFGKEE